MIKKSILYSILICTLTLSLLSGCNSSSNVKNNNKPTAVTDSSSKKESLLPSKESLTPIFHSLLNDFLQSENDYIYNNEKTSDSLYSFLSSDSPLRRNYKELKDGKKITDARLFEQLGSVYDKIEKIEVVSSTSAKVQSTRYVMFSQTCRQGYSLRKIDYELVLENNKWLIKSLTKSDYNPKPSDLKPVNPTVNNDTFLKYVSDFYKTTAKDYDIKIKKVIQTVQYEDRILVTTLESRRGDAPNIVNYFICPLTHKIFFSYGVTYLPNDKDVVALSNDDFKEIYAKAKTILSSEKPIFPYKSKFSDKTPIIASIVKCNNDYIVSYYDQYITDAGLFTCDFNTAVFNKNNNNLILKSNRNSFAD